MEFNKLVVKFGRLYSLSLFLSTCGIEHQIEGINPNALNSKEKTSFAGIEALS